MRVVRRFQASVVAAVVLAGCGAPAGTPAPPPAPITLADAVVPENVDVYRESGFIVGSGAIPFVGLVRFTATEFLDSTAVVVALSIPPRSLSFVRAGDRYAAYYAMRLDVLRGDAIVRSERPTGEVRVASFAETTRGDEGVIFQRTLRLAPGDYALRITAQDSLGTGTGGATTSLRVPAMREGDVTALIPVFVAESRSARIAPLTIVANPRATARYGRDSLVQLYLEAYGATAPDTIVITARRAAARAPIIVDTVITARGAVRSAQIALPVYRLGLGPARIVATLTDGRALDSLTAIVTLGVDLPVSSVEELVEALRYFVTDAELQRFRAAPEGARPTHWASMLRRTDPNPATPDNESLLEFARRLRVADRSYRESSSKHGWQTERGMVVAALGEPDVITEPQADSAGVAHVLTWEYRRHRLFLVFTDGATQGTWRLTPFSAADFRALLALAGPCVGCR